VKTIKGKRKLRRAVNAEVLRAMETEGVSQAELARRLKHKPPTINVMLRPETNYTLDRLEEVASVLGYGVSVRLRKTDGWDECPTCEGDGEIYTGRSREAR
jgi:ribosome-binding protein aMBF1 (putative translation factor)